MAVKKAEGIILRKYLLRETSFLIVLFTKEFGKIRGVIKGIRSPYPQFAGNFEIFNHVEILFYAKKRKLMDLITQCDTIDFFLPLRKDILRLTYANYFIELIDKVTNDYDPNEKMFTLLAETLKKLGTESSAKRISRVFEIKLLTEIGMSPQLEGCVRCGKEICETSKFDISQGGLVCEKCAPGKDPKSGILLGTINFIKKIQSTDLAKSYQIKVSHQVGVETEMILRDFIRFHVNKPIKSLDFLDRITAEKIVA